MFIKIKPKEEEKHKVTDTIKRDKNVMRYKAILRIFESIHILFSPKTQPTEELLSD